MLRGGWPRCARASSKSAARSAKGSNPGCYVTRFALHEALKSIVWGKLTVGERVVVHRVGSARASSTSAARSTNPPSSLNLKSIFRRFCQLLAINTHKTCINGSSTGLGITLERRGCWPRCARASRERDCGKERERERKRERERERERESVRERKSEREREKERERTRKREMREIRENRQN